MKENTIVTLADSNYFEMLEELVDSINAHKQSENISICVLDAGLTNEQIKIIEKKVYKITKANWDIKVPSYKAIGKEWLKSQVSRAFLPNYFPDDGARLQNNDKCKMVVWKTSTYQISKL